MKIKTSITQNILAIVIIILLLLALYQIWKLIPKADPTIIVAIIAGTVTLIANSIFQNQTKKLEIEKEHRQKKFEIYQDFIPKWLDLLSNKDVKKLKTEQDMKKFMKESLDNFIGYASGGVLKAMANFRRLSINLTKIKEIDKKTMYITFLAFEKVLTEIRKDIGHNDSGKIKEGDLLVLFINDYAEVKEEYLKTINNKDK